MASSCYGYLVRCPSPAFTACFNAVGCEWDVLTRAGARRASRGRGGCCPLMY